MFSEHPVPMLSHLQSEKGVSSRSAGNSYFGWSPLLLVLLLGTTEKRLTPSSLYLSFMYLLMWIRVSLNLLFPR